MQLLNMAKAKVSPEHIRHQVLLSYSLAKVMLRLGDSNRALPLLLETVNALYAVSGKNWDSLIGSVLKSIMEACPKVTQPSQALMLATLLSRIEVENQKLDDYFECIIECDALGQHECKKICRGILMYQTR